MNWTIELKNFNSDEILKRIENCPKEDQGSLKTTLKYLYGDISNLPRDRMKKSLKYLSDPEIKVVKWLQTRTNGSQKKSYGVKALIRAREVQYKCEDCGFSDVRALELDHKNGRKEDPNDNEFSCLCANCHNIKSYHKDW